MIAIRIAGCFAALVSLAVGVAAQPYVVQSQQNYGGQIVGEFVPFQPQFSAQPGAIEPIYLDSASEFASSNPLATDVYSTQPVVGQPAAPASSPKLPPGIRKGLFQKIFATGTYIPQFDDDSLGFGDLETGVVLGIPFFRVTAPLLITPRFAVHYLDRPAGLDLPSEVYDAEVSFRHLRKFGDGPWAMNAAVTLGHYSDFEANDADAFRVTGQAFAVYEWSPRMTWAFGVVYLNREDLAMIPAAGFIYQPHPDVKFDALMPRPRVSWRLPGSVDGGVERWAYLGGEFGGGIWSIDRPTTVGQDLLTYNDYRLLIGIEKKAPIGGVSHRLEFGYVFGRELEFSSATPDVRLDDSLFVRVGVNY